MLGPELKKEISYYELQQTDIFVRRAFVSCQLLLSFIMILIVIMVADNWYEHIPLANTVLLSVGGGCAFVLSMALCTCRHTTNLRVAGIILVSVFIGLFFGFITACNLKIAVAKMNGEVRLT